MKEVFDADPTIDAIMKVMRKMTREIRFLKRTNERLQRDAVQWCARAGAAEGVTIEQIRANIADIKGE